MCVKDFTRSVDLEEMISRINVLLSVESFKYEMDFKTQHAVILFVRIVHITSVINGLDMNFTT